jgi:Integrase core domain
MSRSGEVWDNAAMESFFWSLKTERIGRKVYRTRDAARADVFDYIERFYNVSERTSARLGKCYRRCFRLHLRALPLGREQSVQRRERAERRHRMRLHAHRAAARCIKHTKRQPPKCVQARPPHRGNRPTLMNANSASHPGMSRVDDLDLVASFRTVCLLVRSCTTRSTGTRPSVTSARLSAKGRSG